MFMTFIGNPFPFEDECIWPAPMIVRHVQLFFNFDAGNWKERWNYVYSSEQLSYLAVQPPYPLNEN